MMDWKLMYFDRDDAAGGDDFAEVDSVVEIEDTETGEVFQFAIADEFEHEGESFCVLIEDSEEADEFFIVRAVEDEDGEVFFETLEEDESDAVYDAYDELIEEFFEEDEPSE